MAWLGRLAPVALVALCLAACADTAPDAPDAPAVSDVSDPVDVATSVPVPGSDVSLAAYIGDAACKECHLNEHTSWRNTLLAHSMDSLRPTPGSEPDLAMRRKNAGLDAAGDYSADHECVPCHVTGYGEDGGYPRVPGAALEQAERMGSVSCEACHGPGGRYVPYKTVRVAADADARFSQDELVSHGLTVPTSELCETCHNERSPTHATDDLEFDKVRASVHAKTKR